MSTCTHTPKGRLLLIGGQEQRGIPEGDATEQAPDFILQRFVDELTSKDTVLIIPTASEVPEEAAQEYVELFTCLGIEHVEVLDIQSREQANYPDTLALLDCASGVMFTGGDQLCLTALLGGTATQRRAAVPLTTSKPIFKQRLNSVRLS
jgi:cyanophycinase